MTWKYQIVGLTHSLTSPSFSLFSVRLPLLCALLALRAQLVQPPIQRPSLLCSKTLNITSVSSSAAVGKFEFFDAGKCLMSKARVYADVNVHRPREYWDYESLTVQWG